MYVKIPKLNFPIQANGKAPLVQDLSYYDKNALYMTTEYLLGEGIKYPQMEYSKIKADFDQRWILHLHHLTFME